MSFAVPDEVKTWCLRKVTPCFTLFRYDYCPDGSVILTSGGNVIVITLLAGTGIRNLILKKSSVIVETWLFANYGWK